MSEIEINDDSHIVPSQEEVQEGEIDVREAFGLPPKQEQTDEEHEDEGRSVNEPPAKEEEKAELRTHKVKHLKEEVEVDISTDEKLTDHLQRSLALDKERERKNELEKTLDRAAKLAGFKDHAEYAANLDRLEQQQQHKQQNELETLRTDLLDQLEENGVDRTKAEQWINNHPLIKQGEAALEERQIASKQAEEAGKWQPLYQAYPELADAVQKANGKTVEWYTPELQALISRGNDPLLAYEHLNKDKIQQQAKKATEQKVIKQQMLGQRAQVEGQTPGGNEPTVDPALRSAFSAFGLDPKRANKYATK